MFERFSQDARQAVTGDAPPPGVNPQVWNLLRNCRALSLVSHAALQELLMSQAANGASNCTPV